MASDPKCCHPGCGRDAEWGIYFASQELEYAEACSEHVGSLLDPNRENIVFFVGSRSVKKGDSVGVRPGT
jgi:hypothetical protein